MIRSISALLVLFALFLPARADESPAMTAAQQMLDQARASTAGCTQTSEVLVRILCAKQLRVGLRSYYPGFSVRDQSNAFSGFEVDIARRIADFLGVRLVPVVVDTKTRIPLVADGDIDLVIATMSHNVQRDGEVRFVRPHYYASQSVVVGARDRTVHDWDDLVGQTVCLPSGAISNIVLIRHHIRILTFDQPEQLLDALEFNECAFVMRLETGQQSDHSQHQTGVEQQQQQVHCDAVARVCGKVRRDVEELRHANHPGGRAALRRVYQKCEKLNSGRRYR
jgi:ABC-type amino acid transport substrate-binding protein